MLNTQELSNYLTEQLNAIGASRTDPYTFDIVAELREDENGDRVEGILRTVSPEFSPVNGYTEGHYVFTVEFVLTSQTSNAEILQINDIIGELVRNIQGTSVPFENGKGIITLTTGIPGEYEIRHGAGESVPLSFTVRMTYTENAVTSADKHWLLDGVEIAFLRENVTVEQEGMQRKMYTEKYTKTILTGHTKYYNFRIPYEGEVYKSLQREILNEPSLRHTLTYYDGAAFTREDPFTADVVLFRSANASSEKPESSWFDVTFTDVYDGIGKALQYELALIDFPFDMNGEDTRYFASQSEQQAYFEQKAAESSAPFAEIDAPTLENLMITRQVYKNSSDGMSQFDYASKNYAIVKVTTASATKYFYYFVENCTTGSDGQVIADLKMDTVQTYFFDPSVAFSDCMIERAHLNRFETAGNGTVKFVSNPASKIFNSEDGLNFPKRMVKRTKLDLQFTGNATVDAWLNDNVAYWVYVFISPTASYKIGKLDESSDAISGSLSSALEYPVGFNGQTGVLCYPIYKNALNSSSSALRAPKNVIKIQNTSPVFGTTTLYPHQNAFSYFRSANSDASYFYNMKISILPPFDVADENASIDGNNNLVLSSTSSDGDIKKIDVSIAHVGKMGLAIRGEYGGGGFPAALFCTSLQTKKNLHTDTYGLSENSHFLKSEITSQQAPNPAYNPKLNGQNFRELMITSSSGDSFTYDIQKLAARSVVFEYSEPIVPEITRYYMRVQGGTGLYADQTDENYMGLVGSTDNALLFTNDSFAAFLANNKNFYLQSNIKIGTGVGSGVIDAFKAAAQGEKSAAVSGIISTVANTALSLIDRHLTVDNMKNAPDQMKNANGNVILNLFATELGLYAEEYSALDGDLKTANDFMDLYGFTFSSVGNVRDYANIRKYHNYVKAQLQGIKGNLSNVARADLRNRFAGGVRFWNGDTISYEYENYEIWLDNQVE